MVTRFSDLSSAAEVPPGVYEAEQLWRRSQPVAATAEVQPIPGGLAGAPLVAVPQNTTAVTAQSTQPIVVALLRGAALAFVVAAVDFFTSLQLDYSVRDCAVSAALLFFVTLQGRGVIEGAFDNFRATRMQ